MASDSNEKHFLNFSKQISEVLFGVGDAEYPFFYKDIELTDEEKEFFSRQDKAIEYLERIRVEKYSEHKRRRSRALLFLLAFFSIPILFYFFIYPDLNDYTEVLIIILAIWCSSLVFWIDKLHRWIVEPAFKYIQEYKIKLVSQISSEDVSFNYIHNRSTEKHDLLRSRLMPSYGRCYIDDCFEATYRGQKISIYELLITTFISLRNEEPEFRGIGIFVDLAGKKLCGETVLLPKQASLFYRDQDFWGLSRAKLVDTEFENMFTVFTSDQVEARYLFDPMIIESFKNLYHHLGRKGFFVSFKEDVVSILVPSSHDHFEPPAMDLSLKDDRTIFFIKKEIEDVLSIIDILSLYDPQKVHEQNSSKPDQETGTA